MSTLRSVRQLVEECYEGGNYHHGFFRKNVVNSVSANAYVSLISEPGVPKANFLVGAELEATLPSANTGLSVGGAVAPKTKYLSGFAIAPTTGIQGTYFLFDLIAYYPLIDFDNTEVQVFSNPSALPRYSDGLGLQMGLISTALPSGSSAPVVTVNYTDNNGATRDTPPVATSATVAAGIFISSQSASLGPPNSLWLPLAAGSRGVQQANSITLSAPYGGLGALIIAKPLATVTVQSLYTSETDFVMRHPSLPVIEDGAVLCLASRVSSGNIPIQGIITTVWA